jgi:hypothetical protein
LRWGCCFRHWAGGVQLDDHFQRYRLLGYDGPAIQLFVFFEGDRAANLRQMDFGLLPWWSAEDLRHASFRYLSVLTMQLDYLLWPEHPALMHLHSLLWLAALVASTALLFRAILGPNWVAALAVLLYAVEDAHAAPAAYLANRNALIATCLGVLCSLSFVRWRESGWRPGALLCPVLLGLSLAAGEIALGVPAYLVAYALFLDRGSRRARASALFGCGVVLLVYATVYRLGGFGAHGSGYYRDPVGDPLGFLGDALAHVPFLLLGQWTPVPAEAALAVQPVPGLYTVALCVVAVLIGLLAPLVRRERTARFFAFGSLLSLLPIAAVGPENRLLFFVGIGSMGLLAQLVQALIAGRPAVAATRWWRVAAWPLAVVLLFFHLVLAPLGALASLRFQRSVRLDARTLRVKLDAGLFPSPFSRYFRATEERFAIRQRVELAGFEVEIRHLNDAGDPDELLFRFAVPLDDTSLRWLEWRDGSYVPWRPPAVGESVRLPQAKGIFEP